MSADGTFLRMEGISKSFPGVHALQNVDFEVARGEIHALVGENGAGKSTLMKILTGALHRDSGKIILRGQPVDLASPSVAQELGISMIHQELSLIPYLTVGQNIFLGQEPQATIPGFIDWGALYQQTEILLGRLNLKVTPRTLVQDLSIAQQQMVEIAKSLSLNADLIVMDEPTSALSERETDILFDVMRNLKQHGVSIIFISHRLEEVFEIADRITVLRDGQYIGTAPTSELNREQVVRMMVGRELAELYSKADAVRGGVLLQVNDLSDNRELKNISFQLHKGEILGLAGLVGAGRTALAETLFGIRRTSSGTILLEGKPVSIHSPRSAIRLGIGLVPEDRKQQGLFLNMAVRDNIIMGALDRIAKMGFINFSDARKLAKSFVDALGIRTPHIRQKVRNLSGGNQQKVIIARWLTLKPHVLILDEPTRGVDVGAKAEIHALMSNLAQEGVGLLVISSDLPEVLGVSNRIIVMHEGRITAEFSQEEATQQDVIHAATGGRGNHDNHH